jgi:hypothetical protein
MERTGVDRRPGIEVPVKNPIRTSRFAHLARSGPAAKSLLTSLSMVLAAFFRLGSSLRLRWLLFRGLLRQRHMEALSADRPNFCLLTADNPRLRRPEFPLRCGRFFEPGGCSARNVHVKFRLGGLTDSRPTWVLPKLDRRTTRLRRSFFVRHRLQSSPLLVRMHPNVRRDLPLLGEPLA